MKAKETKYILCKFLGDDGTPKGRAYTYKTTEDVKVGDFVYVTTPSGEEKKIIVIGVDVDEAEIAPIADKIKPAFTRSASELSVKEQ